jgi:hypothetical protein
MQQPLPLPHSALPNYHPNAPQNNVTGFSHPDAMHSLHAMPMELWETPSAPLQPLDWDHAAESEHMHVDPGLLNYSYPQPDHSNQFMASMASMADPSFVSHAPELDIEPVNYANYTSWHGLEHVPTDRRPAVPGSLPASYPPAATTYPSDSSAASYPSAFPSAFPAALPPAAMSAASGQVELVPYSTPSTFSPSHHTLPSSTPSFHPSFSSHAFNLAPSPDQQRPSVQAPSWQMAPPADHRPSSTGSQGPAANASRPRVHRAELLAPLPAHQQIPTQPQYLASSVDELTRTRNVRAIGDFAAVSVDPVLIDGGK